MYTLPHSDEYLKLTKHIQKVFHYSRDLFYTGVLNIYDTDFTVSLSSFTPFHTPPAK